jgi:teichuronic acid biosynthesis glycosyltransferase TuaG
MSVPVSAPPRVTAVIPAYNAARYLPETLDSLLAQQDVDLEIIVVDDHSTDSTRDVVTGYAQRDARVHYACTPANCGGPAGPRNLGIEMARSEWIALCAADDLWHPHKLRVQLACAESTGADLVCGAKQEFEDGTRAPLLDGPLGNVAATQRLSLWLMVMTNRVPTSSVLCRRELVRKAGGFVTDRRLVAVEDYDLWIRLLSDFKAHAVRIETPLIAYRRLSGSLSASKVMMARKVHRVVKRLFARKGWSLLLPLAMPFVLASHTACAVYLRRFGGRS